MLFSTHFTQITDENQIKRIKIDKENIWSTTEVELVFFNVRKYFGVEFKKYTIFFYKKIWTAYRTNIFKGFLRIEDRIFTLNDHFH